MQSLISIAKDADVDKYAWSVFTRPTRMRLRGNYHKRHPILELESGDLFGTRRTRLGTYYLVKSSHLNVVYKGITEQIHTNIMKHSIDYKGTSEAILEAVPNRTRLNNAKKKVVHNKQTAPLYRKNTVIDEQLVIDKSNYQWRKLDKVSINVLSKKQGKVKFKLPVGTVIGMRFVTNAKGGYLLYNESRVHIAYEHYVEIIKASKVQPSGDQQEGFIDVATESNRKRLETTQKRRSRKARKSEIADLQPEEPITPLLDLDGVSDEELANSLNLDRKRSKSMMKRTLDSIFKAPDLDTWVETDENESFDSEEDDVQEEDTGVDETAVDTSDTSAIDDILGKKDEEGEEEPEEEPELVLDVLHEGHKLTVNRLNKTYVLAKVSESETNDNIVHLFLHDPEGDESIMYRLNIKTNMTLEELQTRITIEDDDAIVEGSELESIQKLFDYAVKKPLPRG